MIKPEQIIEEYVTSRRKATFFNKPSLFISLKQMTTLAEPRLESQQRKSARVCNEVLVDVTAELEARVREYRLVAEAPLLGT